jgi:hypothetical protein
MSAFNIIVQFSLLTYWPSSDQFAIDIWAYWSSGHREVLLLLLVCCTWRTAWWEMAFERMIVEYCGGGWHTVSQPFLVLSLWRQSLTSPLVPRCHWIITNLRYFPARKEGWEHRLINYKDTKTKCRLFKNWPVKGLSGSCLIEFRDWRI